MDGTHPVDLCFVRHEERSGSFCVPLCFVLQYYTALVK